MNITVFGATGAIGQLAVSRLLREGHNVTAYVRSPSKVPAAWTDRVSVVVGELGDAPAVADAVVSTLGPSMDRRAAGLPLVDGTRNILAGMDRHGVRRFIGNGTPSVLDPRESPTLQTRVIGRMARTLLPRAYREMLGMASLIKGSGLDWTIVRFIAPGNGPAKGVRREGFFGTDRIGWRVRRADIAAFTAAQIVRPDYVRAAPAISN